MERCKHKFQIGDRVSLITSGDGTVLANDITDSEFTDNCVLVKFDKLNIVTNNTVYKVFKPNGSCFGNSKNAHIKHICEVPTSVKDLKYELKALIKTRKKRLKDL